MQTSETALRRAVFLDRDGVLIRDTATYIRTVSDIDILPGAPESVSAIRRAGFLAVVVTNQAAIAHGYITEATLRALHQRMKAMLLDRNKGASLDRIYHCPYHPDGKVPRYTRNSSF